MSDLEDAAGLLRAFGNPTRLGILVELTRGGRCVHELVSTLGASQPLVSQHLKVLHSAGVLAATRRGKEVVYSIADRHVSRIAMDAIAHAKEGSQR